MTNKERLNHFLHNEQGKAYCLAMRSLNHRDDALDAVQDAMFKLVDCYAQKSDAELAPLFYRILFNRIKDMQRKSSRIRQLFSSRLPKRGDKNSAESYDENLVAEYKGSSALNQGEDIDATVLNRQVNKALSKLPERQRETFVLRAWLEMDVKQTAKIMSCSEGSVKTHYSRARQSLQKRLSHIKAALD